MARTNVGGPTAQAILLTRNLDPTRFESRLLVGTVDRSEGDFRALWQVEIPVQEVAGLGRAVRPLDDARALRVVLAEMRRFRPHIVHTHTAKAGVVGRLAALLSGVPATVHTFHGHLLHSYFSRSKTRAIIEVERLLARRTTRIAAEGERVRDELLAAGIGHADQYVVVPPGIDLPALPSQSDARRALGLAQSIPVLAFVGRLTRVKRPDRLVDTGRLLTERFPRAVVLVVGDGELRRQTEEQARDLGTRFRFLGWRADVETIYAAADVVLLTSDNEGMPYSLVEAALAGRPAVTTAVGSAPEVALHGETGLVTEPSSAAVAQSVARLLDDPGLSRDMGLKAQERARREFSATRLVQDTSMLYEQIGREKGFA